MTDKVIIENNGPVRIFRLNRPAVRNCVDGETAVGLAEAIEAFAADGDARVLVVTGAGDLAFCAGADLKNPWSLLEHRFVDAAGPMGFARLDPGKPTIAAINGYCFAGGFELAAWCDFRVAAVNAEFGCLSRRWGVPYTDGGTQRFARIMGLGNALYLLETGARIALIETAGSYVPCEHVGDLDVDQVGDKTGNASALDCLDPIAGLVAPVEDRPQEGTRVENGLSGNLVPPEGCPPAEVRRAGG